ncbi:hypothetical protein C8Q72DRAFT_871846 [Fomitopsis betulina]|nr:hypothetical protein C8Q72DRAFT_871846 [Fomitopsis betulina]
MSSSSEDERSEDVVDSLPRLTWTNLPDLPRLSGPTIFDFGRRFYLHSPTTILKLGVDDGEDAMTAFAHSILRECAPRVDSVVTLSPKPSPGKPRSRGATGLILSFQPGTPIVELWPSLWPSQRATVKAALCDVLLRMRARPFGYYGRPLRRPYVLYHDSRPVGYTCCASRVEWDASRLRALRASDVPTERLPTLERMQRETTGADEWDRPVLTHLDLSDRNILVDPDTLAITGLIDWERANIMPAYFEYVAARLTGAHLPEWRKELLDVLRTVLRRECGVKCGEDAEDGESGEGMLSGDVDHFEEAEEKYRKTLAAWDAMVDVERPAQGYDDDCYWTFETGYPDSDTDLDVALEGERCYFAHEEDV